MPQAKTIAGIPGEKVLEERSEVRRPAFSVGRRFSRKEGMAKNNNFVGENSIVFSVKKKTDISICLGSL